MSYTELVKEKEECCRQREEYRGRSGGEQEVHITETNSEELEYFRLLGLCVHACMRVCVCARVYIW